MDILSVLSKEEYIALSLRALYSGYGYQKYRMSKFEEYDLYVKNKDFLVSQNIITFTDTNGKLLALKPDVTLSIVKNGKGGAVTQKVYYDEKVYRVSKRTESFKEIAQTGVEVIGEINGELIGEVLTLASKSLDLISRKNVLCVSSLSLISSVLDYAKISDENKAEIVKLLGEKNLFSIKKLLVNLGVSEENKGLIESLVTVYGEIDKIEEKLLSLKVDIKTSRIVDEFIKIVKSLKNGNVIVDFSVVNDMNYYCGICFKGYVEGIPTGILSGGEYDNLMKKMNKDYGAIGFAVYLDEVSRI